MKRNIFVYTIALACSLLIAACSQDENITLSNNDKNKILISQIKLYIIVAKPVQQQMKHIKQHSKTKIR